MSEKRTFQVLVHLLRDPEVTVEMIRDYLEERAIEPSRHHAFGKLRKRLLLRSDFSVPGDRSAKRLIRLERLWNRLTESMWLLNQDLMAHSLCGDCNRSYCYGECHQD